MEILFMGTSASEGWPALFCTCQHCQRAIALGGKNIRTRPSLLIDNRILIDPGLDLYHHVLTYGLRLADLTGILITHAHADHLSAEQFHYTAPPFAHRDLNRPLPIRGTPEALHRIRQAVKMENDDDIRLCSGIELKPIVPFESFTLGQYTVTPLDAFHAEDQLCVFYCIERDGKVFLQANDTGHFPDRTWAWLETRKIDGLSIECTNGPLTGWPRHLGIDDVIHIVERLRRQRCLAPDAPVMTTHFSHNGGLLHDELEMIFRPHAIGVAYDGLRIVV